MGASRPLQKMCFAMVCGTMAVFLAASYHQKKHLSPESWQVPLQVEVRVKEHRAISPHLQQYRVESPQLKQSFKLADYRSKQVLMVGSCYQLTGKFKPKHALGNPTTVSLAMQDWVKREFIHGYIVAKQPIVPIACSSWGSYLDTARQVIKRHVKAVPLSGTSQAIILSLVLGDRENLTQDDKTILQNTGTAHLLAISGLHIGLVYLFTWYLSCIFLRPLAVVFLRINTSLLATGLALVASAGYVALSGAGVSSLRAWGMLCVIALLMWRRQHMPILSVLLIAVAVILILDPLAGMGLGLWLSAGAVFALIWLQANRWHVHWKLPLMMAPMTSVFLQSALLGPFANMIAIPYISFLIIPGALLGVMASLCGIPGAQGLLWAVGSLIDILWIFLSWLSEHALMHRWSLLSWVDIVIFMALVVCLLLPWRFVGLIPFMILFAALTWPKPILVPPGELWIDVIDAGQGTAIWLRAGNQHLLFDVGHEIVTDYLRHYRLNSLDVAVVSHHDMDHRAGFATLLKDMHVQKVYRGENLSELPPGAQLPCRAGETWMWGEVHFEFIAPWVDGLVGNNASCVLQVRLGEHSLLLTGDIESKVERALLMHYTARQLKTTLLIAPHHGSKTSSTPAFLQATRPEIVIYPSGFMNSYHHPHPDIVKRYTDIGAKQYNTAQDGALRVKLSRHGIESIQCFNKDHRRWWRQSEEATCSGYLAQVES